MASETAQSTSVEVTGGCGQEHCSTSPDTEMHCQQMFLNAISRIDSNNPNVGKDKKAMKFFCLGLSIDYRGGRMDWKRSYRARPGVY